MRCWGCRSFSSCSISSSWRRTSTDPFWDALAFGALLYALAIVKLQLFREQYMAPVDFIGILYMGRVGYDAVRGMSRSIAVLSAVAACLVVWQNVHVSASYIINRKMFVDANVQTVHFLRRFATDHPSAHIKLYFPQVAVFQIMEFSSFLEYKGLRVAGNNDGSVDNPAITVTGPHRYPDARCFESQAFRCEFAAAPESGDLIVFLPGREKSAAELEHWRTNSELLFEHRPSLAAIERVLLRLASVDEASTTWSNAYAFRH